jgi:tetratricopeptide (TPR) repeat protein
MMADLTPHEAPAHEANALPVTPPVKLIGRDLVLAKVYAQLKENMPVLLHGPAGIGKTALAATLASAYTDLAGGVLWIHVDNTPLPELLVHVGRAYEITEISNADNPLAMIGAVANTLTANKPLVVLDGRIDPQVATDFVTRCADGLPVILTADEQLVGPWTPVQLEKLAPDQAALLFKHLAGMDGADGEENDSDITALLRVLDTIPFAIVVAAAAVRASKQTPAEFLAALPQQPGVNGQLLALTASFRGLNSALQGLMLMMGATLTGQASAELLSMMSGAPLEGIQQAMTMLAQRHLVEKFLRNRASYYRMHPITYTFMQPLLRGSGKLDALRDKMRDSVLTYAKTYSASTPPAYDRLTAEMDTFLALSQWAVERGDRDPANQLAVALMQAGDFVNERGYVYELLTMRRLAASATSAFPASPSATPTAPAPLPYDEDDDEDEEDEDDFEDDEDFEPLPYEDDEDEDEDEDDEEDDLDEDEDEDEDDEDDTAKLQDTDQTLAPIDADEEPATEAAVLATQEPVDVARLRPSLVQARQQGNMHRQAELLNQIGQAQVAAHMENEAISSFSEALTSYEALDDKSGILASLETLANITAKTDNTQAAVLHATRGVQIAEQVGDKTRQARLLTILGDARQQLGESEQAVAAYSLALDIAHSNSDKSDEAMIMLKLGYAQLDDNMPQEAIQTWERALTLFKEQSRRDCEGRVLGGLGTAYGELERWQEAIAFHTSALHIAREVKDKEEEQLQLSDLGYASVQAKQLGQAVLRYRQALHLAYQANKRDEIVSAIVDLAQLLVESQRHLTVAELLVDDAIRIDPNDRDVRRLKERIEDEKQAAEENGVAMIAVSGTAQEYAANAYALLEE